MPSMPSANSSQSLPSPEYWHAETRGDSVVVLTIPGLLSRARDFDIDVSLAVGVPGLVAAGGSDLWHELTLEIDGRRQWSRRVPSHNPGDTDGLDYHLRWRLEAGQSVRARAVAACLGSQIRHLQIEAREYFPTEACADHPTMEVVDVLASTGRVR